MKIITLVPVKNEAWILKFSLKNFSLFSDEIIILDDSSTDESKAIAHTFPKVTVLPFEKKEEHVDMSLRRNILLEEGRKRGGTHFVMLDADEIFSMSFIEQCVPLFEKMKSGEVLLLPWMLVGETSGALVYDSHKKTNLKDFVFCDDGKSVYEQRFLSEPRTPPLLNHTTVIPFETGCVYHFQNLAQKRNQYKQAWYRMNELIKGERSARKINATYDYTKDLNIEHGEPVLDSFLESYRQEITKTAGCEFYLERIKLMFSQKGILFFEALDIWHIDELRELFIKETERSPEAKTFPRFVLVLNDFKNKIRNSRF